MGLITAYVKRMNTPVSGIKLSPDTRNVRPFLNVIPNDLPDPIRSGDFVNEGKAFGRASMPIAIAGYSPAEWHSVSEEEFGRKEILVPDAPSISVPHGSHLPYKERVNISRRQATAYGSLVTLTPQTYDYSLFASRNAGTYNTGQVH